MTLSHVLLTVKNKKKENILCFSFLVQNEKPVMKKNVEKLQIKTRTCNVENKL